MLLDRNTLTQWLWPLAIVLFLVLVVTSSRTAAAENPRDAVHVTGIC